MCADSQLGKSPDGARPVPTLLCVGNDESLLSYRAKVLTQAGFHVVSMRPHQESPHQYADLGRLHGPAVVIACHTLAARQRIRVAQEMRQACPQARLLALTNGNLSPEEAAGYDFLLDSLDGPAALIRQVRQSV